MMDLNLIWFVLFGVLIVGYAILDGFDLGAGVLSLFARDEAERRTYMNAIGPVWDGNEVWLLTAGGALFAAFPVVYATVFSAFYLALVLLLVALIFRAVSFEFRGRVAAPGWRRFWDWAFGLGSLVPALLFGVAVGNILRGLPLEAGAVFTGSFLGLLNPYALLVGLLSLAFFTTHGAIYMAARTEGELQQRMRRRAQGGWLVVVILFVFATLATQLAASQLIRDGLERPALWVSLVVLVLAVGWLRRELTAERDGRAFIASSLLIAMFITVAGVSLFPRLVPSRTDLALSLTAYNASSTPRTLGVMLVVAGIGVPLVLAYTVYAYWVFRGKVVLGPESH